MSDYGVLAVLVLAQEAGNSSFQGTFYKDPLILLLPCFANEEKTERVFIIKCMELPGKEFPSPWNSSVLQAEGAQVGWRSLDAELPWLPVLVLPQATCTCCFPNRNQPGLYSL